jgi:hypothetical protein
MRLYDNFAVESQDILFIYNSLDNISEKGRKDLKETIQFLTALQDHSGVPVPDSIYKEILQNS